MVPDRPPAEAVRGFGGDPAALVRLPGGRGTSWRAGGVVLKPAADEPISWMAEVLDQVPDTAGFRVARPVRNDDGRWISAGWSATGWVAGEHRAGRWQDGLSVSAAFHAALAEVDPSGAPERDDAWSRGIRMAWGREQPCPDPAVQRLLAVIAPLVDQPWNGPPAQIIHADLGNILYAPDLPPAVIDFSPAVAPAPFADAIIVADAVAWEGAPAELADRFAAADPLAAQLLARAVLFRVVAVAYLSGHDPARIEAELEGYRLVVEVAVQRCGSADSGA